jgi:hypothetical protein
VSLGRPFITEPASNSPETHFTFSVDGTDYFMISGYARFNRRKETIPGEPHQLPGNPAAGGSNEMYDVQMLVGPDWAAIRDVSAIVTEPLTTDPRRWCRWSRSPAVVRSLWRALGPPVLLTACLSCGDSEPPLSPTDVIAPGGAPAIAFTLVPAFAGVENLEGRVTNVDASRHAVAVYIFVAGSWWTKPTWNRPLTKIGTDGSWHCDITTGGVDHEATRIAAFLVPDDYQPPPAGPNTPTLPVALYDRAVARTEATRRGTPATPTIEFSGYQWRVKRSDAPVGPGPNLFSDASDNVWVDEAGRLHLKITARAGRWYSAEVIASVSLGLGRYTFELASPVDQLDPNVVLGLFTWDSTAPGSNYREIDIEFKRGRTSAENAQFVVQPWDRPGNIDRFGIRTGTSLSTHWFEWRGDSILFESVAATVERWLYTGPDVPSAGRENARINLWLDGGVPPSNGQEAEVVVSRFLFDP